MKTQEQIINEAKEAYESHFEDGKEVTDEAFRGHDVVLDKEELEKEMGNEVKFAKINIDECPELAEKYNVMSIPTFKCFKNGTEIGTTVGVQGKGDLVRIIKL
jgi:translation initiation factor 2 gamma subunit (eIF-2gamma)